MDRRMLDRVLPGLYALAIVVVAMTTDGKVIGVVAVAGAILLGIYYSGIRPRLVHEEFGDEPRSERREARRERRHGDA